MARYLCLFVEFPILFLLSLAACAGKSHDTSGQVGGEDGCASQPWFVDADGDGYGGTGELVACERPDGYAEAGTDCDDADPGIHPDAAEVCDGVDQDCDGAVDEDLETQDWYADEDGDGYGATGRESACAQPAGKVDNDDDCDDGDPTVYPGAEDTVCDGVTHDCSQPEDDVDGDGYPGCADCDDRASGIHPGAAEICDGLDDDCDGVLGIGDADLDGDGHLGCFDDCDDTRSDVRPGRLEACDGADNDCDGEVDESCYTCTVTVATDVADLQDAVDAAAAGDVVCVSPGTYYGNLTIGPEDISVVGMGGAESTFLGAGEVDVSGGTSALVMDGFTVEACTWTYMGALVVSDSEATLQDLIVADNVNVHLGVGGLGIWGGAPTIRHSRIQDNANMAFGFGVYNGYGGGVEVASGANPLFDDVVISGNQAGNEGAGVYVTDSTPTFVNVRIEGNSTDNHYGGAGVYASNSTLTFLNSTVAGNTAHQDEFVTDYYGWGETSVGDGAGFCLYSSSLTFTNGVVDGNVSDGGKGGAFYLSDSSIVVTNSVVSRNSALSGSVIWADGGTATFRSSDVWSHSGTEFAMIANPLGSGDNLQVDPQFLDGDYHLEADSPLVDAGDSTIVDPDGSASDIGVFGGPDAGHRDADWDGADVWWRPGPFDAATSVGWDCDDGDATLTGMSGCTYTFPDADGDGYVSSVDCDDADPAIHPGAIDACDGVDSDCDGTAEVDADGDGYLGCEDCEDGEAAVHTGAVEIFDGFDTNCDGVIPSDERDEDGDGSVADADCDDTVWTRSPGNFEICNGLDDDCDGEVDETCVVCDVLVPADEPTVQRGVWAAGAGDVVCVYPGTYAGQVSLDGADIDLVGLGGADQTVLDGDGGAPVLSILLGETSTVQGFTVTGAVNGPAVRVDGSWVTFSDVEVTRNENGLESSGGGFSLVDSTVAITHSRISSNSNVWYGGSFGVDEYGSGGGIYASNTDLAVSSVVVSGNLAGSYGGGLYAVDSTVELSSVWISGNAVDYQKGGGVYAADSVLQLTNTVVASNTTQSCYCYYEEDATYPVHALNPGLYATGGSVTVTNSVFADNEPYYGLYPLDSGLDVSAATLDVVSSVLLGDTASVAADSIQNSVVWGRTSTTFAEAGTDGNLSVDPMFLDTNFHLDPSSTLIDAGDTAVLDPDGSTSDIGVHGGPGAGQFDADRDGWAIWWLPGVYDAATSSGYDCDDADPDVWPGSGC